MSLFDWFVLGALAVSIIGVIVLNIQKKKKGGSTCGCCAFKDDCGGKGCS